MIVPRTKMVSTALQVYICDFCGKEFTDAPVALSHEHPSLTYRSKTSDTCFVEEGSLLKINTYDFVYHRRFGRILINWDGPGWYVLHEYQVQYHNCKELRPASEALAEVREKLRALAEDQRDLIKLLKETKP